MISRSIYFRMKTFSEKMQRKSKHTFHVQKLFFSENRAVYEIMWKTIVKPGRPQTITRCNRVLD